MLYWTVKSLLSEPMSVLSAALGIALALILALYLDAVFRGEAGQIVAFIERTPGDVWVLQKGVEDLHMARSVVSENAIAQVRRVTGVESVVRMVYRDALIGEKGRERLSYVAGIPADPDTRRRWEAATGWTAPAPGGVVMPAPMARGAGLRIGDKVRIGEASFTVTGVSSGTFSMANPLVFMDERDARRQFGLGDGANILLVRASSGISAAQLAARIEAESDDVRALPRDQLARNDYRLALEMGGALIAMMSLMGTAVAALIVTFTAYAFVSARVAELAVAKALGAPRHQLILSAMLQTGLVTLLGVALTLGVIGPMEAALSAWVPDVAVDFSLAVALKLGAATLLTAEVAALVPAMYLQTVDPALVFQG